jgi:hypothetical protein
VTRLPFGLVLLTALGCGSGKQSAEQASGGSGATNASANRAGSAGKNGDAGAADTPFERPAYQPQPGNCGFDEPAFCETFEAGPRAGGRSGELDPLSWSVARGLPYNSSSLDDAFRIGPALVGECRDGVSGTRRLPDSDVLVCEPLGAIPSRHALATAAAQNYGLSTYRIRQPLDFAARTGTIKLDLDLSNNSLGGWPALIIAEAPSPTPSFDWQERGSGPQNGVEIEFGTGWCNTPQTLQAIVYTFADYVQTSFVPSFDCENPHAFTQPDAFNHVEVYLTEHHLELWVSDASTDGVEFPNFRRLWQGDLELPFSRGYVSLALRNHASLKYWLGSAAAVRFDNIGFDGPKLTGSREYSAPDSLLPFQGLPGCVMGDSDACRWEGEVIPEFPDDAGRVACALTACNYDGEGRSVGYTLPNEAEADAPPAALDFARVELKDATRARLVFGATYPWFEWNGVNHPPEFMALLYRVNGGDWHERPVSDAEANAFTDFSPELGGAGAGAGLLNQAIDLDLSELRDGDNRIELRSAHTWTGTYRVSITAADLVLDSAL